MKSFAQRGFTLLEFITTLIVASVLGSMMYSFFASSVIHSTIPLVTLKKTLALHTVMENIMADYVSPLKWRESVQWRKETDYSADAMIIPLTDNGRVYKCTNAGTSDSSEPIWPASGTVSDGTVTWTENGKGNELSILADKIGAADPNNMKEKTYGKYYVKENKFIKFINFSEVEISGGDSKDILRVTIKNDGGTLTALFTVAD
ncbi:PulJ/GspJ family protein [Desulfonema magnum]|uniref:Prepilin-type cleavage/methylation domain-containing protein n=1 Tax=Desulfonema magnum TaxID=45655 RepID=A0A975BVE8_9BACT|nr:prepilin-type N-terminal cleavage/methylation domain-containing protein [Desulfonema magnum]QTA92013.1 Prepilin-type cleavage/methylation domain-containing protein [Desulfonema magnum]